MRTQKIVKILPFFELFIQVNIIRVGQKLIKLLRVSSVRTLDFPVQPRRSRLNLIIPDA
jgi:hypothetical protein